MNLQALSVPALSEIPGLVHGFERRIGPSGWEGREASRERVRGALVPSGRLLFLKQVHGDTIATAPWSEPPEADGAIVAERGLLLGIETADCLPVFLVDPVRQLALGVHAGWRGTAKGVVARALEALQSRGSRAEDLEAALGPSIGPCCYEVGEEVREAFGGRGCFEERRGRPHLDLVRTNRLQLLEGGVSPSRIHEVGECTFCRGDLYHSYRRDGGGSGRMVNFVGWGPTGA